MATAGIYNLCYEQGTTLGPITFKLSHAVVMSAAAAAAATTLSVLPLSTSYLSGATLTFGTVTVTLSAPASIGDETLSVNAISAAIANQAQATGNPVDLTGQSARGKIRENYGASVDLATLVCVITDAVNGTLTVTLDSDTIITPNIEPLQFAQISGWSTKEVLTSKEQDYFITGLEPYVWDLETYDTSDPPIVKRRLNGMVAVIPEVTT